MTETTKTWEDNYDRLRKERDTLSFEKETITTTYHNLSRLYDTKERDYKQTTDKLHDKLYLLTEENKTIQSTLDNHDSDSRQQILNLRRLHDNQKTTINRMIEIERDNEDRILNLERDNRINQSTIDRLNEKISTLNRTIRRDRQTYRETLETLRPTTIDSYQSIEIETLPTPEEIELEFRKLDSFTKRQTRDLIDD
jgi:uncharacterized coiled-coil protein SlyX